MLFAIIYILYAIVFNLNIFTLFKYFLSLQEQKGGRNEKEKTKSTRRIQGTVVTRKV